MFLLKTYYRVSQGHLHALFGSWVACVFMDVQVSTIPTLLTAFFYKGEVSWFNTPVTPATKVADKDTMCREEIKAVKKHKSP